MTTRRPIKTTLLFAAAAALVTAAQGQQISFGTNAVQLEEITTGLGGFVHIAPTDLVPVPDGSGRLAVSTINGVVRLLAADGTLLDTEATPFLDTRGEANRFVPNNFAFGMTGIAFHPDYGDPAAAGFGKFYTIVTENHFNNFNSDGSQPDLFDFLDETSSAHHDVIVEWTASDPSSNNPTLTRRDVVSFEQPHENHNVSDLTFGPDGLLYLTSGDGGLPDRFTAPQDPTTFIGSMLRIDPLAPNAAGTRSTSGNFLLSGNGQYRIPESNPGVAIDGGVDEAFAFGFRSPFRFNFDSETGDLYLGDVGENTLEEVSIVTAGGNYGWGRFEGSLEITGVELIEGTEHTPPVFEYGRDDGETVIGGFVYRGSAIPELEGKYIFADFGRQVVAGQVPTPARLFAGDPSTGDLEELRIDLLGEQLAEIGAGGQLESRQFIFSVGQDLDGELYLVVGDDPQFPAAIEPDGRIFKITPAITTGVLGDINQDGFVNGDGTGPAALDDVTAFVLGFGTTGHETPLDQLLNGDLNLDGATDFADWFLLRENHETNLAGVSLSGLLQVPEPASLGLALLGCLLAIRRGRHPALLG